MLGQNILIAPVFTGNTSKRDVYLPKGQWEHFFTGEEYNISEGGWLTD